MNEIYLNIFTVVFALSLSEIIVYSFFISRNIARYTFLISVISSLLSFIYVLIYQGRISYGSSHLFITPLLMVFPPVMASMTSEYLGIFRKKYALATLIFSFILSVFASAFPPFSFLIIAAWFIIFFLYIIYILHRKNNKMFSLLIEFYLVFNIPFLIAAIQYESILIISLLTCFSSILTFFTSMWLWRKRNFEYISLYNRSTSMIKKLNHRITRLKQSNENYKRIISEKDIEILQASRHASLAELTSGIAHELAQPLTGIRGIAQNMIDDIEYGEMEEKQAESDLMKICSLVDKSTSIIDHVRNFTKKSGYSMMPIDLNRAILNAIDLVNIQLKNLSIDIVFELTDHIPKIMGDNLSLEQLIVNIIQNSRDAILEKKENVVKKSGQIKIATSVDGNRILLTIEDNGIGIPDEIFHKIWSPFFTSKKRTHGTGIGLSISNKILKAHNADVDIKTDRKGTRFTFLFPALNKKTDEITHSAV